MFFSTEFATIAQARKAAAEMFASDARLAAVYVEVAGREVRIAKSDLAAA